MRCASTSRRAIARRSSLIGTRSTSGSAARPAPLVPSSVGAGRGVVEVGAGGIAGVAAHRRRRGRGRSRTRRARRAAGRSDGGAVASLSFARSGFADAVTGSRDSGVGGSAGLAGSGVGTGDLLDASDYGADGDAGADRLRDAQAARGLGRDLHRRLFRLELEQRLVGADQGAVVLEPAHDDALVH